MNRIILNIFLIIFIFKFTYGQIPKAMTCSNDPSIISAGGACNSTGDSCSLGYTCIEEVCTKSLAKDAACTNDAECSPYYCNNNKCGPAYYSIAGESCSTDEDCFVMGTNLSCAAGVCALKQSASCKSPYDCGFNKNCVSGECVATSDENGPCTNRYDCNVNLVCTYADNSATSMTCQLPWTKNAGDKCDNQTDPQRIPFFYDCDIGQNLYCGSNGTCLVDKPSSDCTQCNETSACTGYSESCICNNHNIPTTTENSEKFGVCVPQVYINQECKSTFGQLITCSATNNCPMNQQLLLNEGSCTFKSCSQYACKMSDCFRATGAYNMLNLAQTACPSYALPRDYTESCPSLPTNETSSSSTNQGSSSVSSSSSSSTDEPNVSNSMFPSIVFTVFFITVMIILS